ncbi:hypothetical protein DOTSEDRAFT_72120 [Dothistroma septosporum NZE10]|uniref:Uncharacterized protein n=1 Tax=Dothistroma septosporum (strain NZE10 / CBS 128990) TaxID=675120 RepID=N1PM36_DOTSN|nr:hypothetical protein DOTSEDRAFT_72120 [Dothistroma septosporum NZE10]
MPEPNFRKDLYFPEFSRQVNTRFPEMSAQRRPPPPAMTSYGAPRQDHEYVQEWLPRIKPGMPSEGSRSRPSSYLALGAPASAAFATQSQCTHCGQCIPSAKATGDDPFADEYAAPVGDRMKKA